MNDNQLKACLSSIRLSLDMYQYWDNDEHDEDENIHLAKEIKLCMILKQKFEKKINAITTQNNNSD